MANICDNLAIGIDVKRCSECEYKKQSEHVEEEDRYLAEVMRCRCFTDDEEVDHINADQMLVDLLKKLGYTELVKAFDKVDKCYA